VLAGVPEIHPAPGVELGLFGQVQAQLRFLAVHLQQEPHLLLADARRPARAAPDAAVRQPVAQPARRRAEHFDMRGVQPGFLAQLVLLVAAFAFVLLRPHAAAPLATAAADSISEAPGLETEPIHELRQRDINGPTEYLVRNLIAGPIEVQCTLENADNATTDPA